MPFARISRFDDFRRDHGAASFHIHSAVRQERNVLPAKQHFPYRREIAAGDRTVGHDHAVPRKMIRTGAHGKADEPCAARISDRSCNVSVAYDLPVRDRRNDVVYALKERPSHIRKTALSRALRENRIPARRSAAVPRAIDVRPQAERTGSRRRSPFRRRDPCLR